MNRNVTDPFSKVVKPSKLSVDVKRGFLPRKRSRYTHEAAPHTIMNTQIPNWLHIRLKGREAPGYPWFGHPLEAIKNNRKWCIVEGCLPLARRGRFYDGHMIMRVADSTTDAYKNKHPEFYDINCPDGFCWVMNESLSPKFTMAEFNAVPSLEQWQHSTLFHQANAFDVLQNLEDYRFTDAMIAKLWVTIHQVD